MNDDQGYDRTRGPNDDPVVKRMQNREMAEQDYEAPVMPHHHGDKSAFTKTHNCLGQELGILHDN